MPIRPTLWGQPVDLLMTGSDSAGRSGDPVTRRLVAEAIDRLMDEGPSLGRPLADRIAGSRLHNLKELRPGSSGASEVRILFIFDPVRNAVLLVAGDKSGRWKDPGAGRIRALEGMVRRRAQGHRRFRRHLAARRLTGAVCRQGGPGDRRRLGCSSAATFRRWDLHVGLRCRRPAVWLRARLLSPPGRPRCGRTRAQPCPSARSGIPRRQ